MGTKREMIDREKREREREGERVKYNTRYERVLVVDNTKARGMASERRRPGGRDV
jgi:hypothetical protein